MNKSFILLAKYYIQVVLMFPASLVVWIIISFIEPILMIAVWRVVLEAGAKVDFSYPQFVTYYLLSTVYYRLVQVWSLENVSREIYSGTFSNWLLRPLFYLKIDLAHNFGLKVTRLITIFPIFFLIEFFYQKDFMNTITIVNIFILILSLILGFFLYFVMENSFSLISFWTEQMSKFSEIYYIINNFLSGGVLPLTLLPGPLKTLVMFLPFRYLLSFPLEISMNLLTVKQIIQGLSIELGWIIFFTLMYFWLLPKGLRKYTDIGR